MTIESPHCGQLCSYLATITREMEECTKPLGAVYKRVELIHGRNREGIATVDAGPCGCGRDGCQPLPISISQPV